jgi:hypothetical protein
MRKPVRAICGSCGGVCLLKEFDTDIFFKKKKAWLLAVAKIRQAGEN